MIGAVALQLGRGPARNAVTKHLLGNDADICFADPVVIVAHRIEHVAAIANRPKGE